MARKKRRGLGTLNMTRITKTASNINDTMKSLYSDSYFSSRDNIDSLNYIADKMEDNISEIIRRNNKYDVANVGKLYARLMRQGDSAINTKSDTKLQSELEDLFGNSAFTDAVMGSYLTNKWIKDYDCEIDTVLKFCPKLKEALEILKDSVLSADSMSKEILTPGVRISDTTELKIVTDRIDRITRKYDMNYKVEEWYDLASTYGESLVYRVPYKKAIERLLLSKNATTKPHTIGMPMIESGVINADILNESAAEFKGLNLPKGLTFNVEIDTSRVLASSINELKTVNTISKEKPQSLMESLIDEIEGNVVQEGKKLDRAIPDDLVIPDGLNATNKGSYINGKDSQKSLNLDVRGCVIKTLKRENLIRLYVDDILIGYYYLEFRNKNDMEQMFHMDNGTTAGYSKSITTIEKTITDNLEDSRVDHLMKIISKQISDKIDATFVNSNQDLTKEIYAILKHNDIFNSTTTSVKVSFLPPEDVKRLVFREDPDTHIGISDIHDGILPAKLLAMLYTTYVIGTLTRGQDKRVYYVKQTVETNIAQTLLNVINQIKKSNFNMRSIENLNNLLNITGRFNDYIIPVGPSGDSPIQFEVMPGQQFEINQDLFNMLEESAVNSTGVPMEVVQARMSPDFATQYISSSLKLIRKVYRRQAKVELFAGEIYTDIYATEYDEYRQIELDLPQPIFLSMVNNMNVLNNVKEWAQAMAEIEYEGDQSETVDQERGIFMRKLIRNTMQSYMKPSEIQKCKDDAKFEVSKLKKKEEA